MRSLLLVSALLALAGCMEVEQTITEKQVGQATGAFMKEHGSKVDASVANQVLRRKLAGK